MSRRGILVAGLGILAAGGVTAGLVAADVLPDLPGGSVLPWDRPTGPVRSGSFVSRARGGVRTGWMIAFPPGADADRPRVPTGSTRGARLPVCVVLHGRGGDEQVLIELGLPDVLRRAVGAGVAPFALASVAGGDRYWHRRRAGDDSGAMVTGEFLPLLADLGLAARPVDRVGLAGVSMGGYGALLLAETLGAARVGAVSVLSPALWTRSGDSAAGAFDDAADFRAHDVFAGRPRLTAVPLRVDCGSADPFRTAIAAFDAGLRPRPAGGLVPGGHDTATFRAMAPALARFVGTELARPR